MRRLVSEQQKISTGMKIFMGLVIFISVCGLLSQAYKAFDKSVAEFSSTKLKEQKAHCLGEFDTVVCHQLRIEQLLKESYQKELSKP